MIRSLLRTVFGLYMACAIAASPAAAAELPASLHGIWVPEGIGCIPTMRGAPISAIEIDTHVLYRRDDRCTVFRTTADGDRIKAAVSCLNGYLAPEKSGNDNEKYLFEAAGNDRMRVRQGEHNYVGYKRCTRAWQPDAEQVARAKRLRGTSYSVVMFPTTVERPLGGAEVTRKYTLLRELHVDDDGVLHYWVLDSGAENLNLSASLRVGEVKEIKGEGRVLWWLQGERFVFQTEYATYFHRFVLPLEADENDGLRLGCGVKMQHSLKPGHGKAFRYARNGTLVEHVKTSWKGTTCTTSPTGTKKK